MYALYRDVWIGRVLSTPSFFVPDKKKGKREGRRDRKSGQDPPKFYTAIEAVEKGWSRPA